MAKVIIIGVGGVGTVAAHKCAQNPDVFNEIVLASRRREKCDAVEWVYKNGDKERAIEYFP